MSASSKRSTTRTYYVVFVGLMALTALTVGVARVDLGGLNNAAALAIALSKAALVGGVFMHARGSSPLVKMTIAAACLWLAILIGLTMSDFVTRSW